MVSVGIKGNKVVEYLFIINEMNGIIIDK